METCAKAGAVKAIEAAAAAMNSSFFTSISRISSMNSCLTTPSCLFCSAAPRLKAAGTLPERRWQGPRTMQDMRNISPRGHLPMLRTAPILLSAFLLAACVTKPTPTHLVFPSAAITPAPAQTAAPAAQPPAQIAAGPGAPHPFPAARAASDDDGPFTITRAREQCWMKAENNSAVRTDLDKKVRFVEKCVDEKMKAEGQ